VSTCSTKWTSRITKRRDSIMASVPIMVDLLRFGLEIVAKHNIHHTLLSTGGIMTTSSSSAYQMLYKVMVARGTMMQSTTLGKTDIF